MDTLRVSDSLDQIWKIVDRSNKYIDETTPWILAKNRRRKETLKTVMYNLIEAIRYITSLLQPFLPDTASAIAKQTGADELSYASLKNFGATKPGTKVSEASPIFARIDLDKKT